MSLLLEALKKAELAKQAAKEEPLSTDAPPFTRDKLPDITQPMEIRSDDLSLAEPAPSPRRAEKPVLELALEEPVRAAPAAPPPRLAPSETDYLPPSDSMERKQAQQVFEAKEMDVNPRKPFYITVGALGLFALGTVGYFWYQLQPHNNYNIPPPSAAAPAAPLAMAPAPAAPVVATVAPPTGTQPAPAAASAPAPGAAPAAAAPAARPATAPAGTRAATRAPGAAAPAAAPPRSGQRDNDIKITPARVQADPVLESAYQAFNADDPARARDNYQQVLRNDPDNRDALLGLAAVEMQERHYDAAANIYSHLLTLDPRDAYAEAALIGLKGEVDPLAAESRLKNMIAAQPEASFLQFSLGNQYAAQGRWADAQQAYFRAYAGDPQHPDFAYNLAVSLDQLHQSKPALEYYRRALALAAGHPVSFDRAQVSKRVAQLAR
ncbi:MAG: tetratricopeptide repeat protein [Burkholderiales bacterium]